MNLHFTNLHLFTTYFWSSYALTDDKRALTKFLLSIDWDVETEVDEVAIMLPLWQARAPLDVAEALKLLGKERAFQNALVRAYAVECVDAATDDELQLYLLQLVQALKYEPKVTNSPMSSSSQKHPIKTIAAGTPAGAESSLSLQQHLLEIIESTTTSSYSMNKPSATPDKVSDTDIRDLSEASTAAKGTEADRGVSFSIPETSVAPHSDAAAAARSTPGYGSHVYGGSAVSPLAHFLITRACSSPTLTNFLFWYLRVETETDDTTLFRSVLCALMYALCTHSLTTATLAKQLYYTDEYIDSIVSCQEDARTQMAWLSFSDKYRVVTEKLNGFFVSRSLTTLPLPLLNSGITTIPNPLDPHIMLTGLDKCSKIFKSKMLPVVIDMHATMERGESYAQMSGTPAKSITSSSDTSTGSAGSAMTHDNSSSISISIKSSSPNMRGSSPVGGQQLPTFIQKLFFKIGDDLRTDQLILNLFR